MERVEHLAGLLAEQGRSCSTVLAGMLGLASAQQLPSKADWRSTIMELLEHFEGIVDRVARELRTMLWSTNRSW